MTTAAITAFNELKIRGMKIVLTLQQSQFPDSVDNVKTIYSASLPGFLHTESYISRMPAWIGNTAVVVINGMLFEDVIALTKFNPFYTSYYNQIAVYADYLTEVYPNADGTYSEDNVIDAIDKLPLIFLGQISSAAPDFNNPNRPFIVQALVTYESLITVLNPVAISQKQLMSTVVKNLIADYNATDPQILYEFGKVDIDFYVSNIYQNASSFTNQLKQICDDYGHSVILSPSDGKLIVDVARLGFSNGREAKVLQAPQMIGYPTVMPNGIMAKEYFNPQRNVNDQIIINSYFTPLNGQWVIWQIQIALQVMGEAWESALTMYDFTTNPNPG